MTSVHPEKQAPPQDGQQVPVDGTNQPPQQNLQQVPNGGSNQPHPQRYGQQAPGQQVSSGYQPQMQTMVPYMGQSSSLAAMGQMLGCDAPGFGMPWLPPPSKNASRRYSHLQWSRLSKRVGLYLI